jgi:UDP-N-acetylmuramoylalanine--D-glutamate ligase
LVPELESNGIVINLGVPVPDDFGSYDLLVASPGVPDRAPVLQEARRAGLRVMSELEFGYRLLEKNTMVAVTGTNGKTTTTKLVGEILAAGGQRAITCGNIGNPLTDVYGEAGPEDVLVVEVSSFQLQNIEEFRAKVGVVLNMAPDHFDWHRDFQEYRDAKMRLVENMLPDDYLVFNLEDESCRMTASGARGIPLGFGAVKRPGSALWLEEGWVISGPPLEAGRVLRVDELRIAGAHNIENVMAALAASLALGGDPATVGKAATRFEGLEHRMEFVTRVDAVSFYNDSKATNPHAALHAIRSFEQPTVAIMGGRNKGLDFDELAAEVCARIRDGRMRGLVLMGESAPEIQESVERACKRDSNGHLLTALDLYDCVQKAFALASGEGVVLFTPACASFDMFADYEDRGQAFKDSVARLKGSGACASSE